MFFLDKTAQAPFVWSPSSIQRFTTCEYSFYLRYLEHQRSRQHAAAWFGSEIIHRMLQVAYHGPSLEESFEYVWQTACAPLAADLRVWLHWDREYRHVRGKQAKVAWLKAHPDYHQVCERIDVYQQSQMGYLRWNARTTLTDYYRRSAMLLAIPPKEILLPNPWLVEGQWITSDIPSDDHGPFDLSTRKQMEEEQGRSFSLLKGIIAGIPVCGVPDVIACREDGVLLVADYKTSARPLSATQLAMNFQLIIYCELLYQNNIVREGQNVLMGHIYLTEHGITPIWTGTELHQTRLPLIERQLKHAERRRHMGAFVPIAGIATSFHDPCPTCDMAHVCDALLLRKGLTSNDND